MAYYGAKVEYALHTLLNLSLAPAGTAPSARDLADFQRLPVAFIRKLLTQLEKAKLVTGSEGLRGGWQLARAPGAITVLEVAEAAQGRPALFECREIRARCALWPNDAPPRAAISGTCSIHAMMLAAEAALRRELGGRTLADIVDQMRSKTSAATAGAAPAWFADRYSGRRAPKPVPERSGRSSSKETDHG